MGGTGSSGHGDLGTSSTVSTGGVRNTSSGSQELAPGTMVGEYEIEGQIGAGGMGRVYAATHPVIAKRAAVKVLHPELSVNGEAVERFVQEARSVNQIGHANIVDIFSFGTLPDGRCYFVMEWLRGESLRDRQSNGAVALGEALGYIDTITIALEAAHENGVVHRDLKPDNIYLVDVKGAAPQVKLLDFGIAKLLGNDEARVERTRTGNLLGTPAYMSPEQARGHMVDHRTDIYALGCVAYELFTGVLPFPANNSADMIAKHLFEEPPSARALNPELPLELDGLVRRMLAKEARERPTLVEVREVVRGVLALLASPHAPRLATPAHGVPYRAPGAALPTPPTLPTLPQGTRADGHAGSRSRAPVIAIGALAILAVVIGITLSRGGDPAPATASPDQLVAPPPADAAVGAPVNVPATEPEIEPEIEPETEPEIEPETAAPGGPPAAAPPDAPPATDKRPKTRRPPKTRSSPKKRTPVFDPDAPM